MQLCLEAKVKMTLQVLFILDRVTVLILQMKCYRHHFNCQSSKARITATRLNVS